MKVSAHFWLFLFPLV